MFSFSGATSASLTRNAVTTSMNGTQYRCIATNGVNPAATRTPATLTVNSTGGGGGGGGGFPSIFYLTALALAAQRALTRNTPIHPAIKQLNNLNREIHTHRTYPRI